MLLAWIEILLLADEVRPLVIGLTVVGIAVAAAFIGLIVLAARKARQMNDPRLKELSEACGLQFHGDSARGRYREHHVRLACVRVSAGSSAVPRRQPGTRRRASAPPIMPVTAAMQAAGDAVRHIRLIIPRLFKDSQQLQAETDIEAQIELVPSRPGVELPPPRAWQPVGQAVRGLLEAQGIGRHDASVRLKETTLELTLTGSRIDASLLRRIVDTALDEAQQVQSRA